MKEKTTKFGILEFEQLYKAIYKDLFDVNYLTENDCKLLYKDKMLYMSKIGFTIKEIAFGEDCSERTIKNKMYNPLLHIEERKINKIMRNMINKRLKQAEREC